jgi:hypothetical protein
VTVLSDSTSRPLDMQNCLSTRPLSRRQRRKSMAAKQPNWSKLLFFPMCCIYLESALYCCAALQVSDEINACGVQYLLEKRRLEILDMDCASWASLVYAALPAAHPGSTVHASLRFMGVGRRE